MKRALILACASIAVTACAKRPDAIAPATIPMAAYSNLGCQQLAAEYTRERTALAALEKQQNSAASGDAFGVFLVGVPVSSLTGGDKEGQIAISKGQVVAIESNLRAKDCGMPAA